MLTFPHAKINLGLQILTRRADGFHDLQSLFYPVQINDALEILPAEKFSFETFGRVIVGKDNTCVKAYQILKKDFDLRPVKIILHKNIPIGAGLGGGSSDGAYMLKMLNEKFNVNLSEAQLREYASQIGSDCAFFIQEKPVFTSGRGEILESFPLDLSSYEIIIIYPEISVNTAWAYKMWDEKTDSPGKDYNLKKIIKEPVSQWKQFLKNDFEGIVFEKYPSIKKIKEKLYASGALYASLSGSGSAVFGIFEKGVKLPHFREVQFIL